MEIVPVAIPQRKGDPIVVDKDEHPRPGTTVEALGKLATPFRQNGTVTAGNASGVNDGAAGLIIASEAAVKKYGLTPIARILGGAAAGIAPRIMGFGPAPASKKLMARLGLSIADFDVIELNEAFASQGIAVLRDLGVAEDADFVNPNGGAIALGHPLGMSGARITGTAALELKQRGAKRALATMCIGVGPGNRLRGGSGVGPPDLSTTSKAAALAAAFSYPLRAGFLGWRVCVKVRHNCRNVICSTALQSDNGNDGLEFMTASAAGARALRVPMAAIRRAIHRDPQTSLRSGPRARRLSGAPAWRARRGVRRGDHRPPPFRSPAR